MSESEAAVIDDVVVNQITDAEEARELEAVKAKAGTKVMVIALNLIDKSEVALRGVQRQSEAFGLLKNSINRVGVMNAITVREMPGGRYGLIDGLQRFTASQDLGRADIPAVVVSMDDAEMLEAQVITNMSRVMTKPAELSKHLLRIMARNPLMTLESLADRVSQSKTWVEQRLSLNNLTEKCQRLVNEGKIGLINAYALSKVDPKEQDKHAEEAISESTTTFVPRMKQLVKATREARAAGRDATPQEWKPVKHLQKNAAVLEEFAVVHGEKDGQSAVVSLLKEQGIDISDKAVQDTVKLVLAWALNFDPVSQAEQKRQADIRKAAAEEQKKRAKEEREAQRAAQAAEAAADITVGL